MSDTMHLPSNSYDVIKKIIIAYSHAGENTTLDDISKLAVMATSVVSRNNRFLGDLGIISGGNKKTATELGIKLGRALEYTQESETVDSWQEAISRCEVVAKIVTSVRIKKAMTREELAKHILYTSGQANTKTHRRGANTIIDILNVAGHLIEEDGQLKVRASSEEDQNDSTSSGEQDNDKTVEIGVTPELVENPSSKLRSNLPVSPTIALNIQLHLPDSQNPEVYDNLFSSLRKHLIDTDE